MSMTGDPLGEPQKAGVQIVDMVTGLFATVGVLSSLYASAKTGRSGQWVGASLLDCSMAIMAPAAIWSMLDGKPPLRIGNDGLGTSPQGVFACADGEILIQGGKDRDFIKLCDVLGLGHLPADPRFSRRPARVLNHDVLKTALDDAVRLWKRDELYAALVSAGLICGPVNTVSEALHDPQVVANGMLQSGLHPDDPSLKVLGSPLQFSEGAPPITRHAPRLGEHTQEVLADLLGLDAAAITRLEREGVIGIFRPEVRAAS
jgi:crotonobetainyl-CoA:carnitine CoA-transferase CaiB-like acyl-CoA transferase